MEDFKKHTELETYKQALQKISEYAIKPNGETELQRIRRLKSIADKALFIADVVEPCANCKETVKECACLRNICHKCQKPVGNVTFTICNECWDIEFPPKA